MPHILCIDRMTYNLHINRIMYNLCKDWMIYNLHINQMTYNLCAVLNVNKLLLNKTTNSICCETTKVWKIQKQNKKQTKLNTTWLNTMIFERNKHLLVFAWPLLCSVIIRGKGCNEVLI